MADPDNTSFQDPIDWDALNDIVVGTHTFENVLYNPDELDSRAPPYYRTGKTRDGGEPKYQPHFVRTPFFSKRVIGNTGTAVAFSMAIREARNGDDPRWGYSWEADYETGSVTIEIWETN
jgi:hypothetical protein